MDRIEIFKRVSGIVQHVLSTEMEIQEQDTFKALNADALDEAEVMMVVEEQFNIKIEDAEAKKISCVADIVDLVQNKFKVPDSEIPEMPVIEISLEGILYTKEDGKAYIKSPQVRKLFDAIRMADDGSRTSFEEMEEARIASIREDESFSQEDAKPGTFTCHEALDRTSTVVGSLETLLMNHPAIIANPDWYRRAHMAFDELFGLYQNIGAVHLKEIDVPEESTKESKKTTDEA